MMDAQQRKWIEDAMGSPWPDISHIKALEMEPEAEVIETRSCIRCKHPVTGDRCDRCRARQN